MRRGALHDLAQSDGEDPWRRGLSDWCAHLDWLNAPWEALHRRRRLLPVDWARRRPSGNLYRLDREVGLGTSARSSGPLTPTVAA